MVIGPANDAGLLKQEIILGIIIRYVSLSLKISANMFPSLSRNVLAVVN